MGMQFLFRAVLFCAVAAGSLTAADIKVPVTFDTLKNGLRILVVPDTNVAVVSCRLYYFVGSIYESAGSTGLSHMYEHMMFKGTRKLGTKNYAAEAPIMASIDSLDRQRLLYLQSENPSDSIVKRYNKQIAALLEKQRAFIKKDEIWELYQNNGATQLNAWTADDMTAYIVTLPKNKIELFYWIESDRMRNPVLREFVSERDVVMEERRMRYDNKPIGRYMERLNACFYNASPFRNPTIGWASDIQSYTREKLERHINKYYTPDNALVVLVGNIDPATAKKGIERYFGAIPRAAKPKEEVITREPKPIGETRFTVHDDATPRIDMLFHTPGYPSDALYKLDVVEAVFSGRSGRLYRRLVDKEGLCTSVGAGNGIQLFDSYFTIWAQLKNDADPARVEAIIREEIAVAAKTPPTPAEMMRVQNEIRMDFITDLTSLEGISDRLAWFERLRTWKDMLEYPGQIAKIKPEEIPKVVKTYLDPSMMTIGILRYEKSVSVAKEPTQETNLPKQNISSTGEIPLWGSSSMQGNFSHCTESGCDSAVKICGDFVTEQPPFTVFSNNGLEVMPCIRCNFSPGNLFETMSASVVKPCTLRIASVENGYLVPERGYGIPIRLTQGSNAFSLGGTFPKLTDITWLFTNAQVTFCDSRFTYIVTKKDATISFTKEGPVFSGVSKKTRTGD